MRASTLVMVALASLAGACGGEDEPYAAKTTAAKRPPAAPAAATRAGAPGVVINYRRVEDRVTSDKEKKAIRHKFEERDFAPDVTGTENRDPFRSFVVAQVGVGAGSGALPEPTERCPRKPQARGYSARELKLIGIVSRGTIRYALFGTSGTDGYIVRAGDCIGKEKARVKEINVGYVTLEIAPEAPPNQPPRPAERRTLQLHPKDQPLDEGSGEETTDDRGNADDLRRRSDELLRGGGQADPAPTEPPAPPAPMRPSPTTP